MAVYILHFEKPVGSTNPRGAARHYVGYTEDFERRRGEHLNQHKSGSPLVRAAISRGIAVIVAHVIQGAGRQDEKQIKRQKNTKRLCPICQQIMEEN